MTSRQIREKYIKFFTSRGHKEIAPAKLVPENDPSTLFTSSGMQPLVPYLLGQTHPAGKRLVDSQPSFRAEDIEEVGDNRHTTFFEMLGNWSLGDYFKDKQLPWFWEFLTSELGLSKERLYVSVFEGNENVPKDTESYEIWKSLGVPEDHIFFYGVDKNWWSRSGSPDKMPVGEIGGPDSEVFFEFTQVKHEEKYGQSCHPNCNCGRFMEIGNSVFIQYQKQADGSLKELPNKNVDFGGGLERLTAAALDNSDIFQTDLYLPLIEELKKLTDKEYKQEEIKRDMRIIADHLKAASFLIVSGVVPSNKLQGYVLRRLLRRAAIKMKQLGGDPIKGFKQLAYIIVHDIYENLQWFYNRFAKTPDFKSGDEGEVRLQSSADIEQRSGCKLGIKKTADFQSAEVYKSSLTEIDFGHDKVIETEIIKFNQTLDKGLKEIQKIDQIDGKKAFDLYQTFGFPYEVTEELFRQKGQEIDREQFRVEFEKHRELSRTASAGMFKGGLADHSEVVTKYHTATHLLHQALRDVLGPQVFQKGSNITSERLRFDFSFDRKMTDEEIKQAEDILNKRIEEDLKVERKVVSLEEAKKLNAIGLFNEKYGTEVSIYGIGLEYNLDSKAKDQRDRGGYYSLEFCGGPHVEHTGVIGKIKIAKQEAVSAGIRRIRAEIVA